MCFQESEEYFLEQIEICLNKSFILVDCVDSHVSMNTKPFILPRQYFPTNKMTSADTDSDNCGGVSGLVIYKPLPACH